MILSRCRFLFFLLVVTPLIGPADNGSLKTGGNAALAADVPATSPTGTTGEPAVVPVGKGSYDSFPPANAGDGALKMLDRQLYILNPGDRPIPTNQWWTNLITDRYAGQLWAFPLMVSADKEGINLVFPVKWNAEGRDPVSDFPISVHGVDFKPVDARAKDWGDWTLCFREAETAQKYMDVTLGRGLPYAWLECHGVSPIIELGADTTFFDDAGKPEPLPATGDHFGITYGGRSYGVFAPDGTHFSREANAITAHFDPDGFLVICPLPTPKDLATFYPYAFSIPRSSHMDWTYDPERGEVTTTWKLTTALLKGHEHRLIQGWIPHHYRDTTNDLQFNGLQYLTPRGLMKCAVGTEFKLTYSFHGFPPMLPAPQPLHLPHDFDGARMRGYLTRYAARTDYGNDTYWGGKSLLQLAQYMAMAHELHDPSFEKLRATLRTALTDWFTYTPGEKAHYFACYPNWHALIGFQSSYGSEGFNDNHFHYGYFTTAAAMLGMYDPDFLRDYGPMARLVAKEYANWDRTDLSFPHLRTFDVWEGHSWASGLSSGSGDNQESSSEAMQSWGGLFLLGTMLKDKEMTAAGAMGYAQESRAASEYWFNVHGDNFSKNYTHPIAGMVWSGGILYGTYFSGDPAWIFGIQWLPMSPMLSYLVKDPDYARQSIRTMLAELKAKKGSDTISSMGPALGNVILGAIQQVNPDWAAEQMDLLWDNNDPVAHDNDTPGLTYYFTHANRMLGAIQWDYHMSLPTSCVYYNPQTKVTSYVAFNPGATAQDVNVYKGNVKVGTIHVPAGALVRAVELGK